MSEAGADWRPSLETDTFRHCPSGVDYRIGWSGQSVMAVTERM